MKIRGYCPLSSNVIPREIEAAYRICEVLQQNGLLKSWIEKGKDCNGDVIEAEDGGIEMVFFEIDAAKLEEGVELNGRTENEHA